MRFDQKICFFSEGTTSDSYGGVIPTETIELITFASIEQLPQSRRLEQVHQELPTAYRVKIYFRESFSPTIKHLVKLNNERFRIITTPTINNVRLMKFYTFDIAR
jgi:hypothetical protein